MLVVESMDGDTETRRLSPVALLSAGGLTPGSTGFVNLVNGPADHGWVSARAARAAPRPQLPPTCSSPPYRSTAVAVADLRSACPPRAACCRSAAATPA